MHKTENSLHGNANFFPLSCITKISFLIKKNVIVFFNTFTVPQILHGDPVCVCNGGSHPDFCRHTRI